MDLHRQYKSRFTGNKGVTYLYLRRDLEKCSLKIFSTYCIIRNSRLSLYSIVISPTFSPCSTVQYSVYIETLYALTWFLSIHSSKGISGSVSGASTWWYRDPESHLVWPQQLQLLTPAPSWGGRRADKDG